MTKTEKWMLALIPIGLQLMLFGFFGVTALAVEGTIVAIALLISGMAFIAQRSPMLCYFLFLGFLQD